MRNVVRVAYVHTILEGDYIFVFLNIFVLARKPQNIEHSRRMQLYRAQKYNPAFFNLAFIAGKMKQKYHPR